MRVSGAIPRQFGRGWAVAPLPAHPVVAKAAPMPVRAGNRDASYVPTGGRCGIEAWSPRPIGAAQG